MIYSTCRTCTYPAAHLLPPLIVELDRCLELLVAALFVNVAVALALFADLEEGGDGEDEDSVDAWRSVRLTCSPARLCRGK